MPRRRSLQPAAPDRAAPDPVAQFKDRIVHNYFLRIHMTLILSAVIASGLLSSKLLLEMRVHSMRLRYPLAILGSYLVFLMLIRMWIWYVARSPFRTSSGPDVSGSLDDIGIGGSGGGGSPKVSFGGGSSGGAGASDSWDSPVSSAVVPQSSSGSSSGSRWFSGGGKGFDLDFDDDGVVLILIAVLVLGIVCAGGYLIYVAPNLLPECAFQAVLASTLTRVTKRVDHENWVATALRASAIPFAIVLILAGTLGWAAHSHCPSAVKMHEVFHCPAK